VKFKGVKIVRGTTRFHKRVISRPNPTDRLCPERADGQGDVLAIGALVPFSCSPVGSIDFQPIFRFNCPTPLLLLIQGSRDDAGCPPPIALAGMNGVDKIYSKGWSLTSRPRCI
jgi:hypothetical protein